MNSTTFTRSMGVIIFGIALLFSCMTDQNVNEPVTNGSITLGLEAFSVNNSANRLKEDREEDIHQLKVTIKSGDGKTTDYTQKNLERSHEEGKHLAKKMELPAGDYQIISIYLEDSTESIIYATPNTGALLAEKTSTPLPFSFTVAANSNKDITLEALSTRSFSPEDFGFDPSMTNFKEECDGGAYEGDVLLQSQTDVDEFGANCYTAIKGDLRIEENQTEDPIVDLRPLFSLNNVTSSLDIKRNTSLESLDGLQNIGSALTVSISNNKMLESLNGLNGMENIYLTFSITSNPALISLFGLEGLTDLSYLSIISNSKLADLSGLDNLEKIGNFSITHNESLVSLSGMPKLKQIKELRLESNSSLISLSGFNSTITSIVNLVISYSEVRDMTGMLAPEGEIHSLNLLHNRGMASLEGLSFPTSFGTLNIRDNLHLSNINAFKDVQKVGGSIRISNNAFLRDLEGLENLTSVGNGNSIPIEISKNRALTDFCSLTALFSQNPTYAATIKSNGYNPTVKDIIKGDCAK